MAFQIHKTDDGRVPGLEYLPCGAIAPQAGMAMKMASGKLAAAAGPAHLFERGTENGSL